MNYKFLCIITFISFSLTQIENVSLIIFPIDSNVIYLEESNHIIRFSELIKLNSRILASNDDYLFNYNMNKLTLLTKYKNIDTLIIEYQKIGLLKEYYLYKDVTTKDLNKLINDSINNSTFENLIKKNKSSKLNKSGSIYRGFRIGTESDLTLESSLNINLYGPLNDAFYLKAVISDESIPIQPEGTTQNISEIDKIYIEVASKEFKTIIGDHNISYNDGGIYNYQKRLQGLFVSYRQPDYNIETSVSNARTNFHTYEFLTIDGVQGPYQIKGKNNLEDIIIIAGTEKLYLNGSLLQRGKSQDYIIEYGDGTIEFTSNLIINANDRVEVDFEYVGIDQKFNKSILVFDGNIKGETYKYKLRFISEKDDTSSPLEQFSEFNKGEKNILELAGDNPVNASKLNIIKSSSFNYYDKIFNPLFTDSIFIYKVNGDGTYNVQFSNVGENKGSYRRISRFTNEYVFVGKNKGQYEPIKLLPLPKLNQQITQEIDYKFTNNHNISLINTITKNDMNTLSTINDNDNIGTLSGFTIYNNFDRIPLIEKLSIQSNFNYETEDFNAINKYQETSFSNIFGFYNQDKQSSRIRLNESALLLWNKNNKSQLKYTFFNEKESYKSHIYSIENNLIFESHIPDINLNFASSNSSNKKFQYRFDKQNIGIQLYKRNKKINYEFGINNERRIIEDSVSNKDSKSIKSIYSISSPVLLDNIGLSVNHELNYVKYKQNEKKFKESILTEFSAKEASKNISNELKFAYKAITINDEIRSLSSFEKLNIFDLNYQDTTFVDENYFLIENKFNYRTEKNDLEIQFNYQVRKIQTAIKEAVYRKVENGYGQYSIDSITNEYIIDPIAGNYLRFILPSGTYIPVVGLTSEVNLRYQPKRNNIHSSIYTNFLNYISITSQFKVLEETRSNDPSLFYFKTSSFMNDKTLLGAISLQNYIYIDRSNANFNSFLYYKYDERLNNNYIKNSELLNNKTRSRFYSYNANYKISEDFRGNNSIEFEDYYKFQSSNNKLNRLVYKYIISQDIAYFPFSDLSLNTKFSFHREISKIELPAKINVYNLQLSSNYKFLEYGNISSNIVYSSLEYAENNQKNVLIPFELANGKKIGANINWDINASYEISNNTLLYFYYNGRKFSFDKKPFHFLKMEVQFNL